MALIRSGNSAIDVRNDGRITAYEHSGSRVESSYSSITVGLSIIEPHHLTPTGDSGWRFLTDEEARGSIQFVPEPDGVALSVETETAGEATKMELTLAFTADTRFHLPDGFNIVRLLDSDMPVGRAQTSGRGLNFCVVECADMAIAIRTEEGTSRERLGEAKRTVIRTANGFLLTVSVPIPQRIVLSTHPDLASAGQWFAEWMERDLGLLPRAKRVASPGWVDNTRLVITVDMLRSTGEIAHSYGDLEKLAAELASEGCPKDTVFYIPGWNGPYDAAYPDYLPRRELGGESAFERMMVSVHRHGFRVMIHTNPDGLDPYHRDIDSLIKYALKDKEGRYAGFQTPSATKLGIWGPPFRFLPFSSGRRPIRLSGDKDDRGFITVDIPDCCEACITVGGLGRFSERITVAHEERTMRSPDGWFASREEFTFPFALRLQPGENRVRFDGPSELPSGAWYRIHDCRVPLHPEAIWTYPILTGDVNNDEWNALVIGNIARTVERYGIDAVHCDAADYEPTRRFFAALRDRLPGTAIGGEYFTTLSGYGYFDFSQGWRNQSLIAHEDSLETGTDYHQMLPDASTLADVRSWLDKVSPLTGLTNRFTRIYPHLCHADAFVPVGKVCTCSEALASPLGEGRLRQILDDAPRLGYIPGLRVNYGRFGLDEQTAAYVRSLTDRGMDGPQTRDKKQ